MKWLIRTNDDVRFNLETGMAYDKYGVQLSGATSFVVISNIIAHDLGVLVQGPQFEKKAEYPRIFESDNYFFIINEGVGKSKMYTKVPYLKFYSYGDYAPDLVVTLDKNMREKTGQERTSFIQAIRGML